MTLFRITQNHHISLKHDLVFAVLDRVGLSYEPVKEMSAERKARILLLAHRNFGGDYTVSVVHEEGGRTYLRGWCPLLGLGEQIY